MKKKNMDFIYFYEDKRKDKTPSGISFPRAFPKWFWVHLVVFTHREFAFGVRHEYGDRENV